MTELAQEGANVAICALTATTVVETAAHIHKTAGREVLNQALDVFDLAAVAAFVPTLKVRLCLVEICVTNCGSPPSNIFKNTPPEARRAALDQLLMSIIYFARESLPRMRRNK